MNRHESPIPRVNPSGGRVWVARWTDKTGRRRIGLKEHGIAGTYKLKREAQDAINRCYELDRLGPASSQTVRGYLKDWLRLHPRALRTEETYLMRVRSVIEVPVDGIPFGDWPMENVTRRHTVVLVDDLLSRQGRAARGAQGVIATLSAMWRDAMDDERVEGNPFMRARIRQADPRVRKAPRAKRVYTFEQMRGFARAAAVPQDPPDLSRIPAQLHGSAMRTWEEAWAWRRTYAEPMIRVIAECGLRIGEVLPLERADVRDGLLHVRRTAWRGTVQDGYKMQRGWSLTERQVPLSEELHVTLHEIPECAGSPLLFPTPGGLLWRETNFYRDLWYPARKASGMAEATPHLFRHSWVSNLRAAGIDPADLAEIAGHTVEVATAVYTHSTGRSFDDVRRAVAN